MRAQAFWRAVVADHTDFLSRVIELLTKHGIRYCVLGGQGVNAYVDPVVSLDLDVVIAVEQLPEVERLLGEEFTVERFPHSVNVSARGSDLRLQLQTDPRYQEFVSAAKDRDVLGYRMNVASLEDVLQGKVWAYMDRTRRKSKRQKDLADILRIIETYPELESSLPEGLREELHRCL